MSQICPILRNLLIAGAVQTFALLLAACVLDMGGFALATRRVSAGFWFGVIVVLIRRHNAPTAGDRLFLRWGLIPVLAVGIPVTLTLWAHRGIL